MNDTDPLRLGVAPDLIFWPFRHALSTFSGIEVVTQPFEALARAVAQQELDCALVPVLDALRLPLSVAIPGAGVAGARGLCVATSERLPAASRLAVPAGIGSAVGLVQIVLQEEWGTGPVFEEARQGDPLDVFDGMLVEDGRSVAATSFPNVYDMGALWEEQTGLPCVQALWLARFRAPLPELRRYVGLALQRMPAPDDLALEEAAEAFGVDKAEVAAVVGACTYRFGSAETESVRLFAALARKYGLCDADAAVTFC